jgi:hypothetical protein
MTISHLIANDNSATERLKDCTMTRPTDTPGDPAFQALLDIYGADRSRWPADAARRYADLPAVDRRALQEAGALDQVLARASRPAPVRQADLAARIMAQVQAEATRPEAVQPSNVVHLSPRPATAHLQSPSQSAEARSLAPARRTIATTRFDWRLAASLAAALLLGLGVGVSGNAQSTIQAVADTVGVNLERSQLAFNDVPGGTMAALDDEDVL